MAQEATSSPAYIQAVYTCLLLHRERWQWLSQASVALPSRWPARHRCGQPSRGASLNLQWHMRALEPSHLFASCLLLLGGWVLLASACRELLQHSAPKRLLPSLPTHCPLSNSLRAHLPKVHCTYKLIAPLGQRLAHHLKREECSSVGRHAACKARPKPNPQRAPAAGRIQLPRAVQGAPAARAAGSAESLRCLHASSSAGYGAGAAAGLGYARVHQKTPYEAPVALHGCPAHLYLGWK